MFNKIVFHHIGKIVPLEEIKDNPTVKYSPLFDMYSLDKFNDLTIPIELHSFGPNSSLAKIIQTNSHVAFTVDNIDAALLNQEIIMEKYTPFKDYTCAMILINGQPVELIETTLSEKEIWGDRIFKDSSLYPR